MRKGGSYGPVQGPSYTVTKSLGVSDSLDFYPTVLVRGKVKIGVPDGKNGNNGERMGCLRKKSFFKA